MPLTSRSRSAYLELLLGQATDRATGVLPATTTGSIFTIAGGRILLLALLGEVTTIIQAQATTLKVVSTPTVGTAVDLCATLDVSGKEVGALLGLTGLFADALVGANAGATVVPRNGLVLPIGAIRLTTGATSTGSIKWRAFWLPLDVGATCVAA
jgi:hypothetical protein